MEKLQNQIISASDLPLKITDSFPNQPYYKIQLTRKITSSEGVGIFGGFFSTGGRVTASDYSGRVTSDQLLSCYQVGIHYEKMVNENSRITPFIQTQLSILSTRLKLKDEIIFANGSRAEEITLLTAQNVAIEPVIGVEINMLPFPLRFGVGFLFNITDFPLHLKGNKDAKLRINGSYFSANLSGIRLSISSGLGF
ncbi:MAG TPA: hypothetical protein VF181_09955 [Balneolaceae bacterium]